MIYIIIGFLIPNTVGGVLLAATGGGIGAKIIQGILCLNPFYLFYEGTLYLVIKQMMNSMGKGDEDLGSLILIVTPRWACFGLLALGIVFFNLAVYLDYKRSNNFRHQDLKEPTQQPLYLTPDINVLQEEQ